MIAAIADTHTVIWYLFSDERLGRAASALIESTIANGDHIGVSAISFAKMVYLIEKDRIQATPNSVLQASSAYRSGRVSMRGIPRHEIPDLPDRIIAATARLHDVPVLSRDGRIRASIVKTIW
jgi:PIN domain nuclease of toxin-antitoxin system